MFLFLKLRINHFLFRIGMIFLSMADIYLKLLWMYIFFAHLFIENPLKKFVKRNL